MRSLLGLPPKIPETWRRKLMPGCPNCGRQAAPSLHVECKSWRARRDDSSKLYLDIATGLSHCIACGHSAPIERWTHHCTRCDGVYEGGEVWQGMAAEMGRVGDAAWLRAMGVRRGVPEITFLGWSHCRGCGRHYTNRNGLLRRGSARGGICESCYEKVGKRMEGWMSLYSTSKPCSWCHRDVAVGRIVRVGWRGRMCYHCYDRMRLRS